ncbi:SCO family protein [Aureivirga sp. CE67]|uniref:SCO family protein n=1 Tax=Aureivirga sp. CE67 TaxID=1788983 RepID=UPI0018CA2021|nr:SCO family protein [Aureivirga sp. CE67]
MKLIKYILLICFTLNLISCKEKVKNNHLKTEVDSKKDNFTDLSIYNLPSNWTNQDNKVIQLKELKGDVLVMVMVYTTCKVACPRLVADMRTIESKITKKENQNVKYILVSIDPKTDTPEKLKEFAIENKLTDNHWMLLRGTENDTREFAGVLAVNYKKISPMDFSHSNIISVFNQEGELTFQKEGLGINIDGTVDKIKELVNPKK